MRYQQPYVMHDQVHDLVPRLMTPSKRSTVERIREWMQMAVFGGAVLSYLTALSLTV